MVCKYITEVDVAVLETKVNELLQQGYRLEGTVVYAKGFFVQLLVKLNNTPKQFTTLGLPVLNKELPYVS